MADFMLGSAMYFNRVIHPTEALLLIRGALDQLGPYHGTPLRPYLPRQIDMLASGDVVSFKAAGYLLILNHEGLAAELQEPTFLVNVAYLEPREELTQIQMFFAAPLHGSRLSKVWHYALDWISVFVRATSPSLAVVNAIPEAEDHPDFLPSEKHVRPGEFPRFFVPWNYLGPDRLNEERLRFLELLPAATLGQLGEGWVLQVVHEITERPSHQFVEALNHAPGGMRVQYRQPEITS